MNPSLPQPVASILDTAARLFDLKPFDDVHMDDVAADAQVSKMTLYKYFSDKVSLYVSLLEQIGRHYLATLRKAEAGVRGCRAKLETVTRAALQYFAERPRLLHLLDRARTDCASGDDFPWLEVQQEVFRMLRGLLAEGIATREFSADDLDLAVRGILGTMRFEHLYPSEQRGQDDIAARIIAFVVRPAIASASACAA
jgi:AcrR family transcriptional regulator